MKRTTLLTGLAAILMTASAQAVITVSITLVRNNTTPRIASDAGTTVGALVDDGSAAGFWNNVRVDNLPTPTGGPDTPATGWYVDGDGNEVSTDFNFALTGPGPRTNTTNDDNLVIHRSGVRAFESPTVSDGANALTLTNTEAVFGVGGVFDLYVYGLWGRNTDSTLTMQVNGTTTTYSVTGNNSTVDAIYTEGTDYLVIPGLTAIAGTIGFDAVATSTGGQTDRTGIGAFQLVAVPEPSSYALLGGIAALGLILVRRRLRM